MTQTIGTAEVATTIAEAHHDPYDYPADYEMVGRGTHRTVYLDRAAGVVYKIGDSGANREEARVLTGLRARGVEHAPMVTLHTVRFPNPIGLPYGIVEWMECTVVAMPYLPDDGSVQRPYPILEGCNDFNFQGNVTANGGQLWLIDAGGI